MVSFASVFARGFQLRSLSYAGQVAGQVAEVEHIANKSSFDCPRGNIDTSDIVFAAGNGLVGAAIRDALTGFNPVNPVEPDCAGLCN